MLKDSGHENQTRQGWGGVGFVDFSPFPSQINAKIRRQKLIDAQRAQFR